MAIYKDIVSDLLAFFPSLRFHGKGMGAEEGSLLILVIPLPPFPCHSPLFWCVSPGHPVLRGKKCPCPDKATGLFLEVTSGYPVRYSSGQLSFASNDLSSRAFGLFWGHTRNYRNVLAGDRESDHGQSWVVEELSHIQFGVGEGNSQAVVIIGGSKNLSFQPSGAGWTALFSGVAKNLFQIGSTGDAGDRYTSLDRFGRLEEVRWTKAATTLERVLYGYDRVGNRTWRDVLTPDSSGTTPVTGLDEKYAYDGLYLYHPGNFSNSTL